MRASYPMRCITSLCLTPTPDCSLFDSNPRLQFVWLQPQTAVCLTLTPDSSFFKPQYVILKQLHIVHVCITLLGNLKLSWQYLLPHCSQCKENISKIIMINLTIFLHETLSKVKKYAACFWTLAELVSSAWSARLRPFIMSSLGYSRM